MCRLVGEFLPNLIFLGEAKGVGWWLHGWLTRGWKSEGRGREGLIDGADPIVKRDIET